MTNSQPPRESASGMSVLDYALGMAALGYPVYPTRLTRREDGKKEPMIPAGWRESVSTDADQIRAWFKPGTKYNAYLIDCEHAGLVVVDLDRGVDVNKATGEHTTRDGPAEWERLGGPLARMIVETASGGRHHYFASTDDWRHSLGAGKAGLGVDVQGVGKCVFGPGSEVAPYEAGEPTTRYTFVTKALRLDQLSAAPVAVIERGMAERRAVHMAERSARASERAPAQPLSGDAVSQAHARVQAGWEALAAAPEGTFNDTLNTLCFEVGRWAATRGWGEDEAATYIIETMAKHPTIGEADANDLTTINSTGIRNGLEQPWEVNPDYGSVDELIDMDPGEAVAASQQAATAQLSTSDLADALIAEMLDTRQLKELAPPQYLVKKLLVKNSMAQIYGASGSFKTFGVLGLAAAVGGGSDWHGYAAEQGDVVYIAAEGSSGISKRVRAWEHHHQRDMAGVLVLPRAVQLIGPESPVLIAAVERLQPALVIIDTQARSTVNVDENSNSEMGRVLKIMDDLRRVSSACIVLVHHTGKDADGPERGASAIRAGVDTQIEFKRSQRSSALSVSVRKQKDDEEITDIRLELKTVALGRLPLDEADEEPTSCVLVAQAGPQQGRDEAQHLLWDFFNPPAIGIFADPAVVSGAGAAAIPDLARYMAQEAREIDSIGRSRAEAVAAFARAGMHSRSAVERAWGRLHSAGALESMPGVGQTGRSVWKGPLDEVPENWT